MNGLSRYIIFVLATIAATTTAFTHSSQDTFFPKSIFSANAADDQFWAERYSRYLISLRELSLYRLSKTTHSQSYRFLWLRTFHHPVSVRVDIASDGGAMITVRVTSGAGGYSPGHLIQNHTRRLKKNETAALLAQIDTTDFWNLVPHEEPPVGGADGAQWVIEGVKDGKYHLVSRWSPKSGAVHNLGLSLAIDLGHLKVPAKEIY